MRARRALWSAAALLPLYKFAEVIVYQQNATKAQAELAHSKGFASDRLNLLNPNRRIVSRQKLD